MRKLLVVLLLVCGSAAAQTAVDVRRYPEIEGYFHRRINEPKLNCQVKALKPMLGFSFRFQAGYMVRVPMRQFFGPGHKWLMLTKVSPESGDHIPLYLAESLVLPDVPKTNMELQLGGVFLTGEGRYAVEWVMTDETGRICRAGWHTEARLRKEERSVSMAIEPNTAQGLSFRTWSAAAAADDTRKLRITVLLHAAPLFPRMTKLRAYDRGLWLGSLVSLLDSVHPEAVRLVVFNLEQQKELFRRDDFAPSALGQVAQAMNSIELGLVDYKVLRRPRGHVDVLADLVNQELRAKQPADAVVFLGPTARFYDKIPESVLEEHPNGTKPRFFYFQYKPYWSRGSNFPDSIAHAMKRLKGRTIVIHSPGEFAKAIEELQAKAVSGDGL